MLLLLISRVILQESEIDIAECIKKTAKLESGYSEIDSFLNVTTGRENENREPKTENQEGASNCESDVLDVLSHPVQAKKMHVNKTTKRDRAKQRHSLESPPTIGKERTLFNSMNRINNQEFLCDVQSIRIKHKNVTPFAIASPSLLCLSPIQTANRFKPIETLRNKQRTK